MSLATLILGISVFLFGAVVGTFAVFVIGIHKSRADRLTDTPRTHAEAVTRRTAVRLPLEVDRAEVEGDALIAATVRGT